MRLLPDLPNDLPVKWGGEPVYWTPWKPQIKITHYPPAPCEKCGGTDYLEASGCLPIRRFESFSRCVNVNFRNSGLQVFDVVCPKPGYIFRRIPFKLFVYEVVGV